MLLHTKSLLYRKTGAENKTAGGWILIIDIYQFWGQFDASIYFYFITGCMFGFKRTCFKCKKNFFFYYLVGK